MSRGGKVTHGMSHTRVYGVWRSMMQRCYNEAAHGYKDYGGDGIHVCARWHSFQNFYTDMGDPPKGYTLDRKDNDGDYGPDNCRWATRKEQNNNYRQNHLLTFQGVSKNMMQWSEETGIPWACIRKRLLMGWSVRRALTTAVDLKKRPLNEKTKRLITHMLERGFSIRAIHRETGIGRTAIQRMKRKE